MFSEFNSNELGGIFHLLHFASRVENCSEIIKRACSFNSYLRVNILFQQIPIDIVKRHLLGLLEY